MNKKARKIISGFEIWLLVIAIISFSYFIGNIDEVKASEVLPTGCCVEANDGSICQSMLITDSSLCKSGLIASDCEKVDECNSGCCYSPLQGGCTLNAPKGQCIANGGNWTNDESCNIPECSVGCCILGEEAALKTNRECTLLTREFKFEKNFQQLDADGSCDSYSGLSQKGACVTETGDGSGENNCVISEKGSCTSDFYAGYLCTAPELNTLCLPSTQTSCIEGKDEVYFIDSCGNQANVYDSSRAENMSYWTKIISPKQSCQGSDADCGNCDYLTGSRCYERRAGRDITPTYGDNVCRDLSCKNGRQHGESWCIYDFSPNAGVAPVGSRHFLASCVEGETSITGCADFNQEICVENAAEGSSEAMCVVNSWRSCLNANTKTNYDDVKTECAKEPQCTLFNNFYGDANVKRSDGEFFAGFDPDIDTDEQGAAGEVGEEANTIIPYCVPRFTPGFQFWDSEEGSSSYGGSSGESDAVCSLGSFICVSEKKRKCELVEYDPEDPESFHATSLCLGTLGFSEILNPDDVDCKDWTDEENWECNIDGVHTTIKTKDLPSYLSALNQRCSAIGSCGASVNLGSNIDPSSGFTLSRLKYNIEGEEEDITTEGYALSEGYLSKLKTYKLVKISDKDNIPYSSDTYLKTEVSAGDETLESVSNSITLDDVTTGTAYEGFEDYKEKGSVVSALVGTLGALSYTTPGGIALIVAAAAYQLAVAIADNQNWSPGHKKAFVESMTGVVSATAIGIAFAYVLTSGCYGGPMGCIIGLIIATIYSVYSGCVDDKFDESEYYILQYKCEAWQPPSGGDCSICNGDVRDCSEYRCKSLGSNCEYYTDLGEPGYCADRTGDIWSAKITPWEKALTEGHKYTNVNSKSFKIEQKTKEELEAWKNVEFGITTDKPASCKFDTKHTKDYDSMQFEMLSENHLDHKMVLSPHVDKNSSASSTPGMNEGENDYYIRCKNFAGQVNEAEFAVKLVLGSGPDLTAPIINEFSIIDGSYLAKGTNSSQIIAYVNEPAECKFSQEDDLNYDVMGNTMTCITNPDLGTYGNWPCYADIDKLKVGGNKFFFKCKDQPDLVETALLKRNINQISKPLTLNVCSTGLEIISLEPKNTVIGGKSPVETTISAETSGCVDNGVAKCSYKFESGNYSSEFIPFFQTDSRLHSQVFSTIVAGRYNITVECIDPAGNKDSDSIYMDIEIDDSAPNIVRAYDLNNQLRVITNEKSSCSYNTDKNVKCNFEFKDGKLMETNSEGKQHLTPWILNQEYFIKCRDVYNNEKGGCGIIVRTY